MFSIGGRTAATSGKSAGIIRLLVIPAFFLCAVTHAQEGVMAVRPAGSDGGSLTMEDAVFGRAMRIRYPEIPGLDSGLKIERAESRRIDGLSTVFLDGERIIVAENPEIVYGEAVSRHEFGIEKGLFWSPDSTRIAFYRKDESAVADFPLLNITSRTGSLVSIKYPMAGTPSEIVSLGIYALDTKETVYIKVSDFDDERYLTNVSWSPDSESIYVQVLDRSQKHMRLNRYDARSGEFLGCLFEESDSRYVEPLDPLYFVKTTSGVSADWFFYRSNVRDGYRNIYLCNASTGELQRVTKVDADVEYIGNDGSWLYYTSSEVSPIEKHLFRTRFTVDRRGKVSLPKKFTAQRLTEERGWHEILKLEDDGSFIASHSSLNCPPKIYRRNVDGRKAETLFSAPDKTAGYGFCEIDLGSVKSADGLYDNYYRLIKPRDFDPSKKYPVIVYVYGGPHSQMVNDSWCANLRSWEMLMAQKGYLVYVQDNRGTMYHGAEYEKAIWRNCGKAEMEDQMEGIRMLCSLPYVDADRIGVHGWSYGGFMTISLMTTYPEVFKVGVAGGPVIDWKWYEVMYGERYMDSPQSNPEGYESTSLIGKATALEGRLLICQGAMDDTVVWQHSLNFVQTCIDNMIQVDYFPYPLAQHNVFGANRVHLMQKVTDYFDLFL